MPLSISGDGTITGLSAGGLPNGSVTADDLASTLDLSGKTVTGLTNDSITEGNTTAEVVDTGSNGHFKVTTEGTERLRVDSSGNINIDSGAFYFDATNNRFAVGTASPLTTLHTNTTSADNELRVATTTSGNPIVSFHANGAGAHEIGFDRSALALYFKTVGSSERMRIDSSGRLLVGGLTSPRTNIYVNGTNVTPFNQIETVVNGYSNGLSLINYSATGYDPVLTLGLSKTNTQGANAIIAAGNDYGRINFVGNTGTDFRTGAYLIASCDNTPSSTSLPSRLSFGVTPSGSLNPVERLRIGNDGAFREATGVYGDYSGASANLCIDSTGHITRGSSSIRYKTQVEDLEDQYADALLECRPVWYRSTSKNDNPDWSFYGLIAEEVAEIDPRLVQWRTTNPVVQEDGTMEHVPCDPVPEGISYDRFVPHLLNLIKRQKEQIETLESRVAQLEGGAA